MANAIITLKVMLESPDVDPETVKEEAMKYVSEFNKGKETKTEIEPIAFGLKALKLIMVSDEANGTTEELEKRIDAIEGVQSVECVDVRRALG